VRQIMFQISNSLQGRRHFCFDANPYAIGTRGLASEKKCLGNSLFRVVALRT
jgi:hypothetical protein